MVHVHKICMRTRVCLTNVFINKDSIRQVLTLMPQLHNEILEVALGGPVRIGKNRHEATEVRSLCPQGEIKVH